MKLNIIGWAVLVFDEMWTKQPGLFESEELARDYVSACNLIGIDCGQEVYPVVDSQNIGTLEEGESLDCGPDCRKCGEELPDWEADFDEDGERLDYGDYERISQAEDDPQTWLDGEAVEDIKNLSDAEFIAKYTVVPEGDEDQGGWDDWDHEGGDDEPRTANGVRLSDSIMGRAFTENGDGTVNLYMVYGDASYSQYGIMHKSDMALPCKTLRSALQRVSEGNITPW